MSTLATHHDGLERVLRGWQFVGGKWSDRTAAGAGDRAGKGRELRSEDRVRETTGAQYTGSVNEAVRPSWFQRVRNDWARRREEDRFLEMVREDPRLRADFMAAKARAEWQD
jgi:hypothetical protein